MAHLAWLWRCVYAAAMAGGFVIAAATGQEDFESRRGDYFRIQVVDEQTGRGVPLVTLTTTGHLRYVTDSNGIVAFYEPGLMDKTVYFHLSSSGYEYPADGFGYRGKAIRIEPGGRETLRLKRLNIAERLYRVTGQGIYRDSLLTGDPMPLENPVLNAQVVGQDTVFTTLYRDRLYWFWGDTARPAYPLGHFATAGATSLLPGQGGLDPDRGVDLTYFTDASGFSRPMAPLSEPGMVWIQGVLTAKDPTGKTRMLCQYTRLTSLTEPTERGWMVFNDQTERFEPIRRSDPDFLLFDDVGHPLTVDRAGQAYVYFATPFPLGVRLRVKQDWAFLIDPNRYEVYTALHSSDAQFRWIDCERLLALAGGEKRDLIEKLKQEKNATCRLWDINTAESVTLHNGTVYWNEYSQQWIMIAVQQGGSTSYLGEVWYARADTPVGPWQYARKIVTHNAYSFYNPKHHPLFDQDDGRLIYFEGTYSHTFSGRAEQATPRYDYNQMMYRLDLSDPRLTLPSAIYRIRTGQDRVCYRPWEQVDGKTADEAIEAAAFYALIDADSATDGVAVYEHVSQDEQCVLTLNRPSPSAEPVFYGLSSESKDGTGQTVMLREYRHRTTGAVRYAVEPKDATDWIETEKPLCRVWPNRSKALTIDRSARPNRIQDTTIP